MKKVPTVTKSVKKISYQYMHQNDLRFIVHNTVNLLMFAGINVFVFETKPCPRGLIHVFTIRSGLVSYLGTLFFCGICLYVFIFAI